MSPKKISPICRSPSGSAIVIVLSFLVLISGLALAFFFTATTERSAARSFADSATVRDLANTALQVVMAQILDGTAGGQPGSDGKPDASKPLAWASQPGMIRTFDTSGSPFRYHKLYSSTNSAVPTFTLSDDLPPANWRDTPALWSDLNAPVADSLGTLNYPILDPSAATPSSTVAATGFAISSPPGYSGSNASAINNPAPMPVRWLYQLKDGSLVAASASGTTVTVAGAKADNPIVGRVAYWTDDETCKINVNTAAEGMYWDTPRFKGPGWAGVFSSGVVQDSIARSYPDLSYAAYQPAAFEFQRYPGHPAQVALSTVFPGITTQLAAGVTPRIVWGGSKGGTIWTGTSTIDLTQAPRKALYASLDEFQFSGTATLPRTNNSAGSPLTKADLEAAKFFLTVGSRAPEVNIFNLPRIACWPVDKSLATDPSSARTTAYDRLIAFCSTLRKDLGSEAYRYFFQRGNPQSPMEDYDGIQRNRDLYAYLQLLTKSPIPGFGGTFTAKYPQDRDQILTEIFDYIRCTNLMDPALGGYPITLAAAASGAWPVTTNQFVQAKKTPSDSNGTHLLGSGQVMPIRIGNTVGFGRFPSLKELGMAFVCVATGELPDTSSITNATTLATYLADTAKPINDEIIKLISNIPSAGGTGIPAAAPTTVSAYLQANAGAWAQVRNKWLASVKTGLDTPLTTFAQGSPTYYNPALNAAALAPTERRVQMVVMERLFSPMAGNAPLYPDLIIQLQGLGSLTISNAANIATGNLFSTPPTTAGWLLKVSCNYASNITGNNPLNTDALFASNCATAVAPTSAATYSKFPYYPFISQPFTVDGNTMSFAEATITHSLFQGKGAYDQQNSLLDNKFKCAGAPSLTAVTADATNLVQKATITFPAGTFPTPAFPSYTSSGIYPVGGSSTTGFYWQVRDWLPNATTQKIAVDIIKYATVRSMTFSGDGRLAALTTDVPATNFTTYSDYSTSTAPGINNLCNNSAGYASAYSRIGGSGSQTYNTRQASPGTAVTSGDFDIIARTAPGPFVNKPDEGDATTLRCPYIDVDQTASNAKIYTPNRIMPSPGMFGSLPSGAKAGQHWQTLLFRPQPSHPQSVQSRPGQPPDHLLMDLFWMPMVEPYAISEPFSTAGKVNMNYQILPFTYINRPTALIGAMKVEMVTTVPSGTAPAASDEEIPDDPKNASQPWRRTLNLSETNGTLRQFREKFATGEIFRSASEICDIYLTPSDQNWTSDTAAQTFWGANLNTADNLREKPYANLYARLTTKSNTYTVHIRAQALQKVPGTPADQWVEGRDRVVAEERSSVIIERYIDVEDSSLPDFATNSTALLSDHCRMRVLSTKRFNP